MGRREFCCNFHVTIIIHGRDNLIHNYQYAKIEKSDWHLNFFEKKVEFELFSFEFDSYLVATRICCWWPQCSVGLIR